jgi:hypothetical protein
VHRRSDKDDSRKRKDEKLKLLPAARKTRKSAVLPENITQSGHKK